MAAKNNEIEIQFKKSLKIPTTFLFVSGIKLFHKPLNIFIEHFIKKQLFYYNFIILYSVIFGEISGVIDCIQTGKSFVELSFNLPCITISILSSVKISFLFINRETLRDLIYKLKDIHCKNDNENFEEVDTFENRRKTIADSVKMWNGVVSMMTMISVVVQIMFCLVPLFVMAYNYYEAGQLVVIYPYLVKYFFFEVYESSYWPLIYFHQTLATAIVCANTFGSDIFFVGLCFYIDMHFGFLCTQFENTVSLSKDETKRKLTRAIRRHQELIGLVNQMELLYSKSTLFHIVAASFLICLSAFIITITDEINVQIAYVTFLMMSLAQISLICYFADMLMRASTEISGAVYKSAWYKADGDAKKIMLLVMIRSQKACKLTAWRFVDLNLGAFTKILSTSWSYFALLKTMYK